MYGWMLTSATVARLASICHQAIVFEKSTMLYQFWFATAAGRWPADEAAFRKTKAALGCQLAEALGSSFGASASASEECVDVLSDGFAFRLFLWSTRCSFGSRVWF